QRSDEATVTSSPKLVRSPSPLVFSRPLTTGVPRRRTAQTNKIDSDSQNADLDRPHVNGGDRDVTPAPPAPAPSTEELENKHISDIVDDLVNSTEVSISGGSDNEAAKSDASKTKDS